MFRFYRAAMCVPKIRIADTVFNTERILALIDRAAKDNASFIVFPELAVTGSTCGDLFHQPVLLENVCSAVSKICAHTKKMNQIIFLGAPVLYNGLLYNACLVIQQGKILGIIPKSNIPDCSGLCEKSLFSSGAGISGFTGDIPFGTDILFTDEKGVTFGVEIGEDLQSIIPPGSVQSLAGANVIISPAAGREVIGEAAYRRSLVRVQSSRCTAAYIRVSAGVTESTTDSVCGGHCLCAENGRLITDSERFRRDDTVEFADIDIDRICGERLNGTYAGCAEQERHAVPSFRRIRIPAPLKVPSDCRIPVQRLPFVPSDESERAAHCRETFEIQTAGLAKRFEHAHSKKLVIGISGGLDSTLALLVCAHTMKILKRPADDVIAVTMPGFGTTGRTYNNACGLCRLLGTELREISIVKACRQHFKDIGHDPENKNVVYENTQARERTQILLDIANAENALAVGTGDLSEGAMGWCTYNGDHISMYSVNCSVPKTLIRHIIEYEGKRSPKAVRDILRDIIDTPVSPELLPAGKNGEIKQKTEDLIGPYEVHDFFLYHFIRYGAAPEKILTLAKLAFPELPEEKLARFLGTFLRRFFTQQFKRSCSPDGPRTGTVALSPRGSWKMPSDAAADSWVNSLPGISGKK